MKIVLSEEQLERILSELYGKDNTEKLMDMLLDKVSSEGISSLTTDEKDMLMKLSRGEEIESGDDEEIEREYSDVEYEDSDMDDPLTIFLKLFPDTQEMEIKGNVWSINVFEENNNIGVYLTNLENDSEIVLIPFVDGDKVLVEYKGKTWSLDVIKDIPDTIEKMKVFVEKFTKQFIPTIINKLIK